MVDVIDYLEGDAKAAVLSPKLFIKRGADQSSHKGKVHATQEQWNKAMKVANRRGMVAPADERAINRDSQSHLITNGGTAPEGGAALHQQPHCHQ